MTATSPVIDIVTVGSLLLVLSLFLIAYTLGNIVLPKQSSARTKAFFVWLSFDVLIHTIFEGSFLYNCFFTYLNLGPLDKLSSKHVTVTPPGVQFLGDGNRIYGAAYGSSPTAKLWQEYTKADRRWGSADLTVISIELLTVGLAGPIAAYCGYLLTKGHGDVDSITARGTKLISGKLAFWLIVLATGELYGGFMTFAPEWLSGSTNLDTSNWMYLWLYLTFFNGLWVVIPIWTLYEAYGSLTGAIPLVSIGKKQS